MSRLSPALLLALTFPALGQELDASGLEEAPDSHDPRDPTWAWSPADDRAGQGALTLSGGYASAPAVRTDADGRDEVRTTLLDDLVGARLGALYDLGPVALGASFPLWLSASGAVGAGGPAPGDAHLWVPVSLHRPPRGRPGWGWAVVPYAGLPTGTGARLLGDGFSPGLLTTYERRGPRLGTYATAGFELDRAQEAPVPGGPKARLGLGGSVALTPSLAAHLEARGAARLTGAADLPAELAASLRGRHAPSGLFGSVGASMALLDGVGAAPVRLWIGAGYGPATRTGDLRGVPVLLEVRTADGVPVRGATVTQGGVALGTTDASGALPLARALDWREEVRVEAPGMTAAAVPVPAVDAADVQVALGWAPVPLHVHVGDPTGRRLDGARISVDGPERLTAVDGVWSLAAGTWTVAAEAPGFGRQTRTVTVEPGRTRPLELAILLQPAVADGTVALSVVGVGDQPVEGARLSLDGADLGTVGSGGEATVEGLSRGAHTARVVATGYAPESLEVAAGAAATLALDPTGSPMTVVVRDAEGRPTNATLVLRGPERVAPRQVGADGQATVALAPGTWQVEVSAPTLGAQERTVAVTSGDESAEFVLLPDEGGTSELVLHVVDAAGLPVDRAAVSLDGQAIGASTNTGELRLRGLQGGERTVVVEGDGLERSERVVSTPIDGLAEAEAFVTWRPGTVEIDALGPDTRPLDAEISFSGPSELAPVRLGSDGSSRLELPEGTWTLTIAGEGMAPQVREVVIGPGGLRSRVDVALDRSAGSSELALRVTDPEGTALPGATLRVDGIDRGETSSGLAVLGGLSAGAHVVEVAKPGFAAERVELEVPDGRTELALDLDWAGVLRLGARAGRAPVEDAVVRIAGPRTLPPSRLEGTATLPLGPGSWDVLVSSATHGMRQEQVELGPTDGLRELVVDLGGDSDELAVLLVRVQDDLRTPVEGAEVRLDGTLLGTTSPSGAFLATDQPPGAHALDVSAAELEPEIVDLELAAGSQQRHVRLAPLRTPVSVRLIDAPPGSEVWVEGPHAAEPAPGTHDFSLGPGRWEVLARGIGTALHRRVLDVPHGWWQPMEVALDLGDDVLGRSVAVHVVDPDGQPVSGAEITIGGVLAGTTDRGGELLLPEVPDGAFTLVATSEVRAGLTIEELPAVPGAHVVHVQLGWLPGSVKVIARDRAGAPVNAAAGFRGPRRVRPIPLGDRGQRVFVLPEGTWRLEVDGEGLGAQERGFAVRPGDDLIVLEAVLGAAEAGGGELALTVRDPDGAPIDRAAVSVDGQPVGTTGNLGEIRLFDLALGERVVAVDHPELRGGEHPVRTVAGLARLDAMLRWLPGTVEVVATGPEGPVDAVVRLRGPQPVAPVALGSDGQHRFSLDPGEWDLLLSSPEHGNRSRELTVPRDAVASIRVAFELGPESTTAAALPASLRVVATAGGKPVTDGILRAAGPELLPPVALGADGTRELALVPGEWQVLLSSASWGLVEQTVVVRARAPIAELAFDLARPVADEAVLLVRVEDEDRRPVPDAEVFAGDRSLGRTSPGGALLARGLSTGAARLRVAPPAGWLPAELSVELAAGSQERAVVLEWPRTAVSLSVRDRTGKPIPAAEVLLTGPVDLAPVAITDGQGSVSLRPGEWTALATAPDHAPLQRTLTIAPGDEAHGLTFPLSSAKAQVGREEITIADRVHFEVDSASIKDDSQGLLDEIAGLILANPGIVLVEIGGHTDNSGGRQYNLELSQRRAQAVRAALVAKGVFEGLLVAKGYGLSEPVQSNDTAEGRAANRRVQFEILEWAESE